MLSGEMREFAIEIAGKAVGISPMYGKTREQCERYLTEGKPEISVSVSQKDIARMREKAVREDILEGKELQEYSDAYLETLAVYRKICEAMVDFDTVLMHGSVVAVDGVAYLFTAKSGTGKSTHTKFWRELFGERAVMVNDDKPLLKLTAIQPTPKSTHIPQILLHRQRTLLLLQQIRTKSFHFPHKKASFWILLPLYPRSKIECKIISGRFFVNLCTKPSILLSC